MRGSPSWGEGAEGKISQVVLKPEKWLRTAGGRRPCVSRSVRARAALDVDSGQRYESVIFRLQRPVLKKSGRQLTLLGSKKEGGSEAQEDD